jgi:hypothetical protein
LNLNQKSNKIAKDTMNAEQNTMNAEQNTMNANQNTMNAEQNTMNAEQNTMNANQNTVNANQIEISTEKKLNLNQKSNKIAKDTMNAEQNTMNANQNIVNANQNTVNAEQIEISTEKKLNLNQKSNKIAKDTMNAEQIEILTEKLTKINQLIEECNITEGRVYDYLIKEKKELEQQFNNLNVNNQNILNMQTFAKKIINKEHTVKTFFKKIIEKNNVNALIHSPTQVGKTAASKEFIENCLDENLPVIVSCDNKSDQLEQFYNRIANDLNNENVTLVKISDSKYIDIVEDCLKNNKKIVMFCLDNASQIKKLRRAIMSVRGLRIKLEKIAIIHDEGDVITKDCNIEDIENDQSESHKEWLILTQFISQEEIELKRIFVTATPENVVYKYKIEDVIRLRVPNNYIGYDKIEYVELEDKIRIKEILTKEQNRRILEKENGVILYCVDKKIEDGQDETFVSVCSYLECVVNTYNGNGITARVNNEKFEEHLEKFVKLNNKVKKNKKIIYTDDSTNETKNVWNIKGIAIKDFYQICKEVGSGIIVTIGMDLMARGISFVSSEKAIDTVAATTMLYKPGTTMHAVGLCQTIGRITGTARPDLQRRLYASKSVIENYINYNENQMQYLKEISRNENVVTSEIMKTIELNKKLSRPMDRKKLGLKPMYKSESESETESEIEIESERMKKLINNWWNADTKIGKILKFVYDSETGVSEDKLMKYLKDNEYSETWYTDLHQPNKNYKIVFERTNNRITKIKNEAIEYIKNTM